MYFPLAFQNDRLYNFSMSQSSKLYRLQIIDSQLDENRLRLEELEKLLNDQTELRKAEEISKEAETKLAEEQKKLRLAELNVKDQRIKIEQNEATLYSGKVRNPKELQDIQNEVASAKRYLDILEDRQLELMVTEEETEAAVEQIHAELLNVQARNAEQQAHLLAEKTSSLQNQERLDVERKAASNALTADEMDLYTQLRKNRRGIAVAKVIDRTCSACGTMLTPALVQSANSPTQLVRCSTCGRILFPG